MLHRHRRFRSRFRRKVEDRLKVEQRDFGLAVDVDDVPQFLQRSEDEERVDEEREKLADADALGKDQVKHQEQNGRAQEVHAGPLDEAEAAQIAHLFQLQLEDLRGGRVEARNLLLRQAQALHQFDIAKRFSGGPRQRGGLRHDHFLYIFDLAAEHRAQSAQQRHGQEERGRDGPVHLKRVDHNEDHTDQCREEDVDHRRDEFLDVRADLLQFPQCFAAALILEKRVGQFQRMANAVGVHARPHLLCDEVHAIVLKILGDSRHEGDANGRGQQQAHAAEELHAAVFAITGGVGIDDVPENQGVQQRKNLVHRGQHQSGSAQLPMLPEIAIEDSHRTNSILCLDAPRHRPDAAYPRMLMSLDVPPAAGT